MDSIPELGRSPGRGHGNPLQYSCLENPHGQRSLAGYSAQGHKESDTIEEAQNIHRSKQLTTLNVGKDIELQEFSFSAGGNVKWYICFEKHLVSFLPFKLNKVLQQYDPAVMLLGIYPTEMKTNVHAKICT